MQDDVMTIYRFYESRIGQQAAQLIAGRMLPFLPPSSGKVTVGLGYCLPYLERLNMLDGDTHINRTFAFMPARQGVCHWPSHDSSRTCLVEPQHLPLADSSVDRMILVHALEHVARPSLLLREVWRVLAPGGRVVIVVPNRLRAWSAAEHTPFGHGRPYSKRQLFTVMEDQMLPPDGWCTALAVPPIRMRGMRQVMHVGERVLGIFGNNFGGALIVHAQKQVYSALPKGQTKVRSVPVFTQPSQLRCKN